MGLTGFRGSRPGGQWSDRCKSKGHVRRIVEIAAIEDHRRFEKPAHHLKIRIAKLLPLRHDPHSPSAPSAAPYETIAVNELITILRSDIRQRQGS